MIQKQSYLIFWILFLGIFLRTIQFATNPPGLFVDEATAGYETLSLLRTGADRWGQPFPIYFVNWGSGQNVLYSYLSIPFVYVFGLSRFSVHLVSMFLGILTLPVIYVAVKRRFDKKVALVAAALLAIIPWHIMLSRWSLESNILPFFVLLGVYTVTRALAPNASWRWIIFALIPWGLALYAYALAFIILPVLVACVAIFYRRLIFQRWKPWLLCGALFAFFALPIALFLIKNFVVHDSMGVEKYLPFSIPLLLTTRLQYVSSPIPGRWIENFFFALSGFLEGDSRSALAGHPPIFLILLPLSLHGVFYWTRDFFCSKRLEFFLLWLVGCIPIFILVDGSVVHFNSFYLPMIVASAVAVMKISRSLRSLKSRQILWAAATGLVILQTTLFAVDYYFVFPTRPEYESAYAKNYDRAISTGLSLALPAEPIVLPVSLEFNWIFVAFYTNYPPEKFQHEVRYTLEYSEYFVTSFGRFFIGTDYLPDPTVPFTYVLGKWDAYPCENPKRSWETRLWKVGRCEP